MFTQPTVNKIASAYQGNPAPLARKVDQDKKQNGGIPKDLRQLMALNDIAEGKESAGIDQALKIPTNMPTVAQNTQQLAQQALQSRMLQQAREQQRLQQKPPTLPLGTPQPEDQPQGLDTLRANVGEEYAEGGIIGFSNGGNMPSSGELSGFSGPTPEQEARDEVRAAEQERAKQLAALEQKVAFLRSADAPQAQEAQRQLDALKAGMRPKPSPTDPNFRRQADPRMTGTPAVSESTPIITSGSRPSAANVNASAAKDNAPMPGGLKDLAGIPSTSAAYKKLTDMMNQDPEAKAQEMRDRYMREVGSRDLSVFDKTAAELQARKERLNAPKAGYDAMMEYLEQIAQGGGSTWMEAGSRGAAGQKALQKSRLAEQDVLMEKILDIGAKKSDAQFAEKKGMFDMTSKERDEIFKRAFDAAKSVNSSDDEAKRLAAQAVENEKNRLNQIRAAQIGAQDRDNLMSRAKALMAADPTKKMTLEQAMQKAAEIGAAGQMESAEVNRRKNIEKGIADIDKKYGLLEALSLNPKNPKYVEMKAARDKEVREYMQRQGGGAGIDTLPATSASGTVPPPPGFRVN
jgi:hypothetical protein